MTNMEQHFLDWQNSKNKSFEYKCSFNKFPVNMLLQSLNKIKTSGNNKVIHLNSQSW